LILLLILSFIPLALSSDGAFHLDPQWERILYLDIPDSGRLLLSSEKTAEAEWNKTLEAFKRPVGINNDHPQCLYTARRLVMARLMGKNFPEWVHCPDYEEWVKRINPASASLIFAGHYPDNPSSLFGHTFIRLHSEGQDHPLLDQAVNFSADVTDEYGFFYALKGLFGFYFGGFSLTPYYMKVNEYSEGESRDIWEYPTTLDREESLFLLASIWELRERADFRYYFITKNCSYYISRVFEAAKPGTSIATKLPWYVIPVESVKVAAREGFLGPPTYRPSLQLTARRKMSELSVGQRSKVEKALRLDQQLMENDVQVLEAASWQLASLNSKADGKLPEKLREREHQILKEIASSKTPVKRNLNEHAQTAPPESGHHLRQFSFGLRGDLQANAFIEFMPGIHEYLDYPIGYLKNSELAILRTQVSFNDTQIRLHQLEYLSMMILRPWYLDDRPLSWAARFTYLDEAIVFSNRERALIAEGMVGSSIEVYGLTGAFMIGGTGLYAHHQRARLYPMTHLFISSIDLAWRYQLGVKSYYDLSRSFQVVPEGRIVYGSSPNLDFNLSLGIPVKAQNLYPTPGQLEFKVDIRF
jgi:hypothetical protein